MAELIRPIDKHQFSDRILKYYAAHRRHLPWRDDPQPYYVWLSEIMLQQTRVETVIDYFRRFIDAFPTVEALAEAGEQQLLKQWEGLGYYSRVRNLQKAARIIVQQYQSRLPMTKAELLTLPGIGPYTAGAIASIAYQQPEVAIDGNLIRVASRLLSFKKVVNTAKTKADIEQFWQELLPIQAAGDFNQAIMDIGATICLPNGQPLCQKCPLTSWCSAYQNGNPMDYPLKPPKKTRRLEQKTVFLLFSGQEIALEKRSRNGVLAGMWQFPMVEGRLGQEQVTAWLQQHNLSYSQLRTGPTAKHIFSHLEWEMISWQVKLDEWRVCESSSSEFEWIKATGVDEIALPTAFRRFRTYIREQVR